jgi:hypothetical protein
MEAALIGLVGVLIGAFLGEYFRRRNRIEVYSQKIFERRLEVYEKFIQLLQHAYTIANRVMDDEALTADERHELISHAILPIAKYCDENVLYIDGYVGAHVAAIFMGAEDVQSISDDTERESAKSDFRSNYKSAKEMILKESGVQEINKHFRLVSRSEPDSPIIRRIKELERERT